MQTHVQDLITGTVAMNAVRRVLLIDPPPLLRKYQTDSENPYTGHCYTASEALYHLLGGKNSNWVPTSMQRDGVTHWFLRHAFAPFILDSTKDQFSDYISYHKGRGRGFLTKNPSKRAQHILDRIDRSAL